MDNNLAKRSTRADVELTPAIVFQTFRECPEMLSPVAALFREAYPDDMQDLRAAVELGDKSQISFIAHKIRGSVSCFHAEHAANIAAELEAVGVDVSLHSLNALIEELEESLIFLSAALEQIERLLAEGSQNGDSWLPK